jgi:hypothetical protein
MIRIADKSVRQHARRLRHEPQPSGPGGARGGVAGAVALTLVHETARRIIPHAPRVDVIGVRAIARPLRAAGRRPARYDTLHRAALAGDLVSNAAYYSLVGVGGREHVWRRGATLGLVAGLGAAVLPPLIGLGQPPHRLTPFTHILTVAWYLIGGLAAAGAYELATRDA